MLIVIVLATITLFGLFAVQAFWVKKAINMADKQFNDRAVIALSTVAQELKTINNDSSYIPDPVVQVSSNYFVVKMNDTLHPYLLESILIREFEAIHFKEDFEYGIYDCFTDSIVYGNVVSFNENENRKNSSNLPIRWDRDGHYFGVYFPQKTGSIINELDFWLFSTLLILFVAVFFVYSIYVMLRQKKLSEIKTDFINNLTHELKTPIATIGLSSEMLKNEHILADKSRFNNYVNIITSESNRLKLQVERVLQLATLDSGHIQLKKEKINLHDLLEKTRTSCDLRLLELKGELTLDCIATHYSVWGDPVHLSNIFYNLIDNAIKYCQKAPKITITSKSDKKHVFVTVKDNGIGIAEEHQKHLFEKFYRVPTGNVHKVKGFGLGLYYVHTILLAHQGTITIKSNLIHGTEFTLKMIKA
ncbi:MAG: two-component system phosphate regulon sensor histidine kinase PhoR [Flavobacteriales bacterium]|jgi:two-component system phosphate regulon sensor histidine kinase PhoR